MVDAGATTLLRGFPVPQLFEAVSHCAAETVGKPGMHVKRDTDEPAFLVQENPRPVHRGPAVGNVLGCHGLCYGAGPGNAPAMRHSP